MQSEINESAEDPLEQLVAHQEEYIRDFSNGGFENVLRLTTDISEKANGKSNSEAKERAETILGNYKKKEAEFVAKVARMEAFNEEWKSKNNGVGDKFTEQDIAREKRNFAQDEQQVQYAKIIASNLKQANPEKLIPILTELAERIIADDTGEDPGWGHTVCHLFEGYPKSDSLLSHESTLPIARKLMEHIMTRPEKNCLDRIVYPVLNYNMSNADFSNLEKPFDLMAGPEAIASLAQTMPKVAAHLQARNAKELLTVTMQQNESLWTFLPLDLATNKPAYTELDLLKKVQTEIDPDVLHTYLVHHWNLQDQPDEVVNVDTLVENSRLAKESKDAMEVIPGTFVDVEGTLLRHGEVDHTFIQKLEAQKAAGETVVIFSGGDPVTLTEKLRSLGVPETLLPVQSKSDYRGKKLEFVVDDTNPRIQGFSTDNYAEHQGRAFWLIRKS